MKKKLEAELISIAHRILKLKNRDELDVLQQETLKLYEKISVLRFVEDNFNDVKPTIGYASAEETLEEIYGIEETPVVHANEQEAEEDEKKAQAKSEEKPQAEEPKEDKPQATSEEPEGDADPEQPVEEYQASEEEKEHTEEETDEEVEEDEPQATSDQPEEESEEPEISAQPEIEKSGEDIKAMEEGAAAVYKKEDDASLEEEEQAADAEVITIEPDSKAKVEDMGVNFEFAFERKPAPDEPQKQKEITFEDYKDYKEPEFVKKGDEVNEPQGTSQQPQAEEEKPTATSQEPQEETRDWRDWEPTKDEPKAEEKPQATSQQPQEQQTTNNKPQTGNSRALTLGLNDRIAFEKNLFGGSGEDLNRVVSQLNTFDSFDEAKEFIADMVKPDYNNWQGKEEYEERFMALVEKKFD